MPITIHADPPLAPTSEMCLNVVRQAFEGHETGWGSVDREDFRESIRR
jgi:hypothetical protein